MTKRFTVLAVLVLISGSAFAQNASISVFATQIRGGWTSNEGSTYDADFGLGAEYWFTPRVSSAVNVARHRDVMSGAGTPGDRRRRARAGIQNLPLPVGGMEDSDIGLAITVVITWNGNIRPHPRGGRSSYAGARAHDRPSSVFPSPS